MEGKLPSKKKKARAHQVSVFPSIFTRAQHLHLPLLSKERKEELATSDTSRSPANQPTSMGLAAGSRRPLVWTRERRYDDDIVQYDMYMPVRYRCAVWSCRFAGIWKWLCRPLVLFLGGGSEIWVRVGGRTS